MATLGLYLMGAALLVGAGASKAIRPADTARALAAALPSTPPRLWLPLVRALATGEAFLGIVAIVIPGRVVASLVAASYAAFTAWVFLMRERGGALASCGCFGKPDTPPTLPHATVTAIAAAGAIGVAWAAPTGTLVDQLRHQKLDGIPLVAAVVAACWLAYLVMVPLARLTALRAAEPYLPGGRP